MNTVLVVSKPFGPPWRDSSKNLARELVRACREVRFRALAPVGQRSAWPQLALEGIYPAAGRHQPGATQQLRVLARLAAPLRADLVHFFAAPNPRAALAARLVLGWRRRRAPTVQTLCSLPDEDDALAAGCFADAVVVLSRHALRRVCDAGIHQARRIAPAVRRPPPLDESRRAALRRALGLDGQPLVLWSGDLEPGGGAADFVSAAALIREQLPAARFVLAARQKSAASIAATARLRSWVERHGLLPSMRWVGECRAMRALLAACDVQVLTPRSLARKMDYPLVLLEGLARGLPLVIGDRPPLCELLEEGRADAGRLVPVDDPEAIAHAVVELGADASQLVRAREAAWSAAADFEPAAMARAYADLYRELWRA
ncbi:MAG: glycosyltransferase family 4 protein [Deltaproteobacteria bacterium]|nr:glycosyltransferase family 4 protein [Deltaproteobacteria bacterium]